MPSKTKINLKPESGTAIPVTVTASSSPKVPIVFMGTPALAAELLGALLTATYHIVGVVTQPDRPVGRKQVLTASPVKQLAEAKGIPVLQPEKLDASAVKAILNWKPDLIVVAAYGKILPKNLLIGPGMGCVNVHASLLPRWRGASPIQNALWAGDTETGITLMLMDEGMDTGDIIAQKSFLISPEDTTPTLTERMATEGAALLLDTLPVWIKRKITPQPQNAMGVRLCQLIEREDGRIFWDTPAEEIFNRYRALMPWPGIFTYWKRGDDMLRLKLNTISLQKTSPVLEEPLGKVFEVGEKIGVRTGSGIIFVEHIQLEGKESLPIREFLNGNPDFLGALLN